MNTILVQTCPLCGKPSEIEVDSEKYTAWRQGREEGKPTATHGIQVIFADRSDADRETILSGTHSDCWDALFGGMDEEESQDPGTPDFTPLPGHVVEIPASGYFCDFCGAQATWDGPTTVGPWAYMCDECEPIRHANPGKTGVGVGQMLVVRKEAPS